jgi:PAS domain S-box-containing protein
VTNFLHGLTTAAPLAVVGMLWVAGRERVRQVSNGWQFLLAGFGLLFFASSMHLVESLGVNRLIPGGIDSETIINTTRFAAYLGGYALILFGLYQWMPTIQKMLAKNSYLTDEYRGLAGTATRDKLLLSTMPAMIYAVVPGAGYSGVSGDEFSVTYVNDNVESLVGFEPEEFVANAEFWTSRIHPEDREKIAEDRDLLLEKGEQVHEFRFLHKDGRYRWLRDHRRLVRDGNDLPLEIIGCAIDVTDLKLAEGRISSFLEGAPDAVITVNAEGKIVLANAQAERLFGYDKTTLIGQPADILVPKRRHKKVQKQREGYFRRPEVQEIGISTELLGLCKDGTEFPVEISLSPLDAGEEKLVAYAIRDMTERKKVEAQLQQAQKMEAVGQLTGGVAHDFNNLLTVIVGNLQLVEEIAEQDETVKKPIDAALDAAMRGAALTKRLLAFSRQQLLAPKVLDVNKLVNGLEPLLHRTLGDDIDVRVKLAKELWLTRVDPSQLENSIINLAINSRDAMPAGGTLVVETSNAEIDETYAINQTEVVPGEYVMLRVGDDGTGIPKDALQHVFDPFFSTKERTKGSGLGLSMVYGFVKQSSGHIQVYSEEGYGTSIKIYLPRLSAEEVDTATTTTGSARLVPTGKETILLVEDETAVREIASTLLRALGYTVLEAEHGPAALEILDQHNNIDLLFTDVVMPGGMNGVELVRQALQRYPEMKTLYTSGYADTAIFDKAMLSRGAELLTKPYRKEVLASKIREILDQE